MFDIRNKLIPGKIYTFYIRKRPEDNPRGQKEVHTKRFRLIKCFPFHASFESPFGYRQRFLYWDLERMIKL